MLDTEDGQEAVIEAIRECEEEGEDCEVDFDEPTEEEIEAATTYIDKKKLRLPVVEEEKEAAF